MRKLMGALRHSVGRHKNTWIVSSAIFLFLAVAGSGAFISWGYWGEYTQATPRQASIIKREVDTVLHLAATDEASRLAKRAALQQLVMNVEKDMHDCRVPGWIEWQTTVGSLKQAIAECEAAGRRQAAFLASLKEVSSYLRAAEQLSVPLGELSPPGEVEPDAIASTATAWQAAAATMAKVTVADAAKQTQRPVVEATASVAEAWREIASAHEAKDQTKYEVAIAKLPVVYSSLQAAQDIHQEQLRTLSQSLQTKYEAAF